MNYKYLFIFPALACIGFLTVYSSTARSSNRAERLDYPTALRLMGHRLLVSAGDSTSRVLPVKKLSPHTWELSFEAPLALQPDSLVAITRSITGQTALPDAYTATVLECTGRQVVYSFVIDANKEEEMVPCLGRNLPKGCYLVTIDFTRAQSVLATSPYIVPGGILLAAVLAFVLPGYIKRKKRRPLPVKEGGDAENEGLAIGTFRFYPEQRFLQLKGERIELTAKECRLLSIFAAAPNTVIAREQLQKEVWEDEGVIVTRSLDVFVSRLRKKLEGDPEVKLVNVHGKGYKLEQPA